MFYTQTLLFNVTFWYACDLTRCPSVLVKTQSSKEAVEFFKYGLSSHHCWPTKLILG